MNEFTHPMTLSRPCPVCGKTSHVIVRAADYKAWQAGILAQNAFPYLSPDEREVLISGICPKCFNAAFADDED